MVIDDLELQKKTGGPPADLSTWNIEDLRDYIADLRAEIGRAEAMIEEKRSVGSAADALFKKS